jgi:alpha-galactosidase
VRLKAPAYFEQITNNLGWALETAPEAFKQTFAHTAWSERGLFKVILEQFGYLPITTDSHFGEYIHWAYEVADNQGILDFYRAYQYWVAQQITESKLLGGTGDKFGASSILESIVTGKRSEQLAVNLPNEGYIDDLPEDIAVEVPGVAYASGVYGVKLGKFPRGIAGLLLNQYAVHDLTAEAVLSGSKAAALQALLVDPVVHSVKAAEQTLEAMLKLQQRWLGYLH